MAFPQEESGCGSAQLHHKIAHYRLFFNHDVNISADVDLPWNPLNKYNPNIKLPKWLDYRSTLMSQLYSQGIFSHCFISSLGGKHPNIKVYPKPFCYVIKVSNLAEQWTFTVALILQVCYWWIIITKLYLYHFLKH